MEDFGGDVLYVANRCILCTRCVRVCDEIEGAHTWDVSGRGIDSRVILDLNESWGYCPTEGFLEAREALADLDKP